MTKLKHIVGIFLVVALLGGCIATDPPEEAPDDDLLSISYDKISGGFLYQLDKNSVVSISDGVPITVPLTSTQIAVVHNDQEISVEYSWAKCAKELVAISRSGSYSVEPLIGSDQYLKLIFDMGYTYLIDTTTGEVSDPFSALNRTITERLGLINFSADGQYAVVSYNSGTECLLLNCVTGEITQIPHASNIYSVSGYMLDHEYLMLISAFELDTPHEIQISKSIYNLATRELTELPEPYTACKDSAPNYLRLLDSGRMAYTYDESGYLVIVDQVSWDRIVTQFRKGNVDDVFYCPNTVAGVICDDVIYTIDYSGNAYAVCKTVEKKSASASTVSHDKTLWTTHDESLLRFLTEVNFGGEIGYDPHETIPPGTPSETCFIPQPEQDQVGKTVSIVFEPEWEQNYVVFHYICDRQTSDERLITILAPDDVTIPMLIVFRTQLGGTQTLLEYMKAGISFEADILAMVNIDYQEGTVYARNAANATYGVPEDEIIDVENPVFLMGCELLGVCGGTDESILIKEIHGDTTSEYLRDHLAVLWKIYERFSLTDYLLGSCES